MPIRGVNAVLFGPGLPQGQLSVCVSLSPGQQLSSAQCVKMSINPHHTKAVLSIKEHACLEVVGVSVGHTTVHLALELNSSRYCQVDYDRHVCFSRLDLVSQSPGDQLFA